MTLPFERELRLPQRRRPSGRWRVLIALAILILVLAPALASRVADWLWYRDIGFERVFLTKIIAQWALGLAAGLGGFALLYTNARLALRGVARKNLHIRDAQDWAASGPKVLVERLATWLALPATLLISVALALSSGGTWRELAQFFYRTPFGVADPVFGRDVSYYVFTMPMVQNVLTFANASPVARPHHGARDLRRPHRPRRRRRTAERIGACLRHAARADARGRAGRRCCSW